MYDLDAWKQLVEKYESALQELDLPPDLTPTGIMLIQAKLDRLNTEARLEQCQLRAELTRLKETYKMYSKIYYLDVKDKARTEKERDALVSKRLMEIEYNGLNLIEAIGILEGQVLFMNTVVSIISSKAQRLINILGSLKLEHSLMVTEIAGESAMARSQPANN